MKANLERGFLRLAIVITCAWWAIGQFMFLFWDINSYPFIRLTIEFEDFFLVWWAVGVVPIVLYFLGLWIARGFRAE